MYEKILEALRSGANAEALTLARAAVAEIPHEAQGYALLASAERANGDEGAAQHAINRAVLLAPDNADLHLQRAGYLLGEHKLDEAQAALARAVNLDPNQFPAYILQAQLALGRGDLEEADRLQRYAGRIVPDHPWVKTIEGMLALRRGEGDRALSLLTSAATQMPDDLQVLYGLGFAYAQQGQLAFAEQAFRKILTLAPGQHGLKAMLADIVMQQGRPDEAREVLQTLLDNPATTTPALKRVAAELELTKGRHESAMALLREALAENADDTRTWRLAAEIWRRTGNIDDARSTIDTALEQHPTASALWQLRISFEPKEGDGVQMIVERWLAAAPDNVLALEAAMHIQEMRGDAEARDALAQRIVEIEPGRTSGETRVIDRLTRQDPMSAVAYVQSLISKSTSEPARRMMMGWLGLAQDRAGRHGEAVLTWNAVNTAEAAFLRPLTVPGPAGGPWPELATALPGLPAVAYLWGLPGSGVDKAATIIRFAGYPLRSDRFGAQPPEDVFQDPASIAALNEGALTPEQAIASWRAALPSRGVDNGSIIDWLPFWDNAFLKVLRTMQPEASVLIVVRDPRDMLLDWLAYGNPMQFAMQSPTEAAMWIARQLQHVLTMARDNVFFYKLIRSDQIHANIEAFAGDIGSGLGLQQIRVPPDEAFGDPRFEPGHWRAYAKPLAEPFALLSDVAQALGYPAT